jgi:2-amino-4-hydroxy-6-hydroxymethyldihydropteridine diphosphokinase
MKKVLNSNLTLFNIKFFSYQRFYKSNKRYNILISIGANVGNIQRRYKKLFLLLKEDKRIDVIETSPLLKNPPFGFIEQNDFVNAVIYLKTNMAFREFFKYMFNLEKKLGRVRTFKNAPRKIDIDLIFFDNLKIDKGYVTVPHYDWQNRVSVILPLSLLKYKKR